MRIALLVSFIVISSLGMTACNTVNGMGKDLESAGRGMQNV